MLLSLKKRPGRPYKRIIVPVERIKDLAARGFTEPEIIDMLRREGYSADVIDRALTEALKLKTMGDFEAQAERPAESQMQQIQPRQAEQRPSSIMPPPPNLPAPVETPPMQIPQVPETSLPQEYDTEEYSAEEYIDYVVKEKTEEINERISSFMVKYKELEGKISNLHDKLSEMGKAQTSGEQIIISKLDSYKELINDVDIRLASLEKTFKDTLPALIESVRALTDLVQRVKRQS